VECEVCGKKVKASAYKRHVSAIHGFITKEEFAKMREEVEKAIQTSIHSALQEHWKGHYRSLRELLEEGEKHAETCPTCKNELEEWLKKKKLEKYKPANRKWM
jgi:ribosomal protein L37AE/L43A